MLVMFGVEQMPSYTSDWEAVIKLQQQKIQIDMVGLVQHPEQNIRVKVIQL